MTQVLSANPAVAAAVDWISWVSLLGRELGLGSETAEIITKNPQAAELLAATGGNLQNIPDLNTKEGTPGAVGNLNALSELAGVL